MVMLNTLKEKVQYRIKRRKDSVFILSDFEDLSDKDQVGRVLRGLIEEGLIVKVGQGLYAKTKISSLSGNRILEKSLIDIAKEVLQKYNYTIGKSKYEKLYEEGQSTQLPTGRVIAVKERVSRKIKYNGVEIEYANPV